MMLWKTADGVSLDALAEEATVSDLVEALQAEDAAVVVTRGHWAGDGIAVTVAGHGRSFLVVPLGEDA